MKSLERLCGDAFGAFGDRHYECAGARRAQGFGSMSHDRLATPARELLRDRLARAQALTGGDNDRAEPLMGEACHRWPAR